MACGLIAFVLVALVTSVWAIAVVPAVIAAAAPHAYWSSQRRRHLAEVRQVWPDGLRDVAAAVNARLPLHEALLDLARTGPVPLQRAFSSYAANAKVLGTIPALEHIRAELADPTTDRVVEVLVLAAERRPSRLADILDELARSITADLRVDEEIRTAKIEPHINTAVAAATPWVLLALITLSATPHRDFYQTSMGLAVVIVAAALTLTGLVVTRALARDPIEARVFSGERSR